MEMLEELIEMINALPENRPLYRDSGLWEIRSEDLRETFYRQGVDETFFDFIERAYNDENTFMDAFK